MREYLLELAHDNPINLDIAEELGQFPTRKAAAVWLARQEVAGELRVAGMMKDAQGRRVLKLYCGTSDPKEDNGRHEIIGTRVRAMYRFFTCQRGHKINDCWPDLLLANGDHQYEVEIHCCTMKQSAVRRRWKRHKCKNDILVIVAPKRGDPEYHLKRTMEWSDELEGRGYFTTLARLQEHGPHAYVWDWIGRGNKPLRRVKLPVETAYQSLTQNTPQTATRSEDTDVETDGD